MDIGVSTSTIRRQLQQKDPPIQRYMTQVSSAISPTNKARRVAYGGEHRGKPIRDFWHRIYFTDEAYFDSVDLFDSRPMKWRHSGEEASILEEQTPENVTFHEAGAISYNGRGFFTFYNDQTDQPKRLRSLGSYGSVSTNLGLSINSEYSSGKFPIPT